jgi:hypothetical protein
MSTVATRGLYIYDIQDLNGNKIVDPAEVAGRLCSNSTTDCFPYGFDINNPGNIADPIHTVGDYKTPMTHEFQLGLDRELMPNFGVSGTFTFRNFNNFNWRNNGLVGTDYEESFVLTGNHAAVGDYSQQVYTAIASRVPTNRAATTYRDREGYSQRFMGLELAATKRLSNRWMARFGFSTNSHKEYFDSLAATTDPTPTPGAPNIDGGTVVRLSTGSGKGGIYQVLPQYQFIATGLYQAPWGINLAGNLLTRQGFAMQYNRTNVATTDPLVRNKTVFLLEEAGDSRLPTMTMLDLRVGKEFNINRVRLALDLDVFNVMNTATVLGRQYNLHLSTGNNVTEITNPRVLRIGARFSF